MSQIGLPFDWPEDEDRQDFIVTAANMAAVDHLDRWGSWPVRATILTGPRKSGRSLLGRIFRARLGGEVIDDAETHDEAAIFHAWNAAQAGKPLLIISDVKIADWRIRLPDLKSRMTATPHIGIGPPDDQLCGLLLAHLLGRRGLVLPQEVMMYLTARIERSYVMILRVVDVLDSAALSQRRAVTIPFVRDVLRQNHIPADDA
jgi:hypothetical protein